MTAPKTARKVPPLFIEQLARGELPPERAAEVRAALEGHELAELAESDAAILAALPPEQVARTVARRVADAPTRPSAWVWAAPLVAVAAAAVLVLRPPPPDTVRLKGLDPALILYRKADDGALRLEDDAVARPGDVLQVAYQAAGWEWGVIFSVDGRGTITPHLPESGAGTAPLGDGEVALPSAYALDDAPDHETFVLVLDDAPLDAAGVLAVASQTGGRGPFIDADGEVLTTVRVAVRK